MTLILSLVELRSLDEVPAHCCELGRRWSDTDSLAFRILGRLVPNSVKHDGGVGLRR